VIKPSKRLTVRTDLHALALANAADLWYSGGGPFQPATFGYTGRPSSSQSNLATLSDVSGDYNVNANVAVGAYYGCASSKAVTSAVYSSGAGARLGYFELLLRF
jgi:hypothetical protein